jgi:UDP-N-acetyl-D-glucosamine dehydrogenase
MSALDKIKEHSDESALVVIESTVPIGTTSSIVEIINRRTAFSPERIDPGSGRKLKDVPKIVSSNDPGILQEATEFYSTFIDNVIPCNNTDEAEAAKLLENSYRLVNISFINEFHNLMDHLRINTAKVIELAETKPFGYQTFYPGLGAGGHCIPVDPVFLRSHDIDMPILAQAINTNDNDVIKNACRMISEHMHDDIENKNIVVLGLGYKSGVSDIRESKALSLIEELRGLGANVFGYDEIIKEVPGYELVNDFAGMDLAIINYVSNSFDMSLLNGINKFFVGRINYFYKGDDAIQ